MESTPVAGAFYVAARTRPGLLPEAIEERVLGGGRLPPSVIRQVRQGITGDVHLRARGVKRAALNTVMTPRDNTYIDERGRRVPMLPGDFFNADDMHLNLPFWAESADASDPCAARWGCRTARAQLLCAQDMASLRIVAHTIWAARSDAYGTYGILWFFRRLMSDVGKPRRGWKLEHGAWASRLLRESLGGLGMHVEHAQTAKGKRIEAALGQVQSIMSMLAAGSGLELGRLRGEFEEGKRLWLDMRAGKIDPRSVGVPHISEMSALVEQACSLYNARVSHGEMLQGASPDEAWGAALKAHPLVGLTERENLLLLPQCSETRLSGGLAKCRHKTFGSGVWWYGNEALFAALGPGYKVRIRYDVAAPDKAAVYSAETLETRMKTRGFLAEQVPGLAGALGWTPERLCHAVPPGEYLGLVTLQQRAPAFVMAQWDKWRAGHEYRKNYHKCVRALYRGATHLADEAHDGQGGSLRVEGAHLAPRPDPAATPRPDREAPAAASRALRARVWGNDADLLADHFPPRSGAHRAPRRGYEHHTNTNTHRQQHTMTPSATHQTAPPAGDGSIPPELDALITRIEAHQSALGLSDARFAARYQAHLRSADSWVRTLKARDPLRLTSRNHARWHRDLSALLARITDPAGGEAVWPLPILAEATRLFERLQGASGDVRIGWLIGPTGVGKSVSLRHLHRVHAPATAYVLVPPAWRDSRAALLGGLAEALGVTPAPGAAQTHARLVARLTHDPVTLLVDEMHEGGVPLVSILRAIIDLTRARILCATHPAGYRRLVDGPIGLGETRQLAGRSLRPIAQDWRAGMRAADVRAWLAHALPHLNAEALDCLSRELHPHARQWGMRHLAQALPAARAISGDEEVTPDALRRAVAAMREDITG
jgi:hypothetical protein